MPKLVVSKPHLKQQLNARVSDDTHKRVDRLMKRDGLSKVELIEAALKAYESAADRELLLQIKQLIEQQLR